MSRPATVRGCDWLISNNCISLGVRNATVPAAVSSDGPCGRISAHSHESGPFKQPMVLVFSSPPMLSDDCPTCGTVSIRVSGGRL